MRVRVDKPRQHDPATRIHYLAVTINKFLDLLRATDPFDQTITNQYCAGCNDAELAHLGPDPRTRRPGKRHHLRRIHNRELHSRYSHAPAIAASEYSIIPQTIPMITKLVAIPKIAAFSTPQ